VRDGFLAQTRDGRAATAAVTSIPSQVGGYSLRRQGTGHNRQVAADHGMPAELSPQGAFGVHAAGEHDEAAGLLVQTLHDSQARQFSFRQSPLLSCDQLRHQIFQRRGQFLAPLVPRFF